MPRVPWKFTVVEPTSSGKAANTCCAATPRRCDWSIFLSVQLYVLVSIIASCCKAYSPVVVAILVLRRKSEVLEPAPFMVQVPPVPVKVALPPLAIENATLLVSPVEEAMLNALSDELYPIDQALVSTANCALASPVPALSPKAASPVLSIENNVVVALAVEEPMAKRVALVSPFWAWSENLANGEVVPTPVLPPVEIRKRSVEAVPKTNG